MVDSPMLLEIILPLETFPAHFTAERQLGTLVRPLVDHQIVGLGEPPLAVLADELALGSHFSSELPAAYLVVNLHYSEHLELVLSFIFPDCLLIYCRINASVFLSGLTNRQIFPNRCCEEILFFYRNLEISSAFARWLFDCLFLIVNFIVSIFAVFAFDVGWSNVACAVLKILFNLFD